MTYPMWNQARTGITVQRSKDGYAFIDQGEEFESLKATASDWHEIETRPTVDDYRAAIDAHVETTARSRDYNSAAHLASYAASTVPLWASEAAAFIAWRDQVWVTAIGMMQTLQEPLPIAEVLELLPQIEWPE